MTSAPCAMVNAYLVARDHKVLHCLVEAPDKYLMTFARNSGVQLSELPGGHLIIHNDYTLACIQSVLGDDDIPTERKWVVIVERCEASPVALGRLDDSVGDRYLVQFYIKVGGNRIALAEEVVEIEDHSPGNRRDLERIFLSLECALEDVCKLYSRYWKIAGGIPDTSAAHTCGIPPGRFAFPSESL